MWQNLQEDLGKTSFFEANSDFQYLAIKRETPVGNYLYLPYGPVADSDKGFRAALRSLRDLADGEDVMFIRVEPQAKSTVRIMKETAPKYAWHFEKTKDENPAETWCLDLKGNDEALKERLPSRLLRYYRNREKQGITIETSKNPADIRYLLNLQKALASKKGINTFSEKYLQTELSQPFATLYLVKKAPANVIAAGLVFDDGNTRYNLQGAQSDEGRRLHATGILTIQLILDAKAKNLKTFDFWGIAPEGAPKDHPWAGFTAFKKTFAGYEKTYAGAYDLIMKPAKYQLYKLLRKIRRMV